MSKNFRGLLWWGVWCIVLVAIDQLLKYFVFRSPTLRFPIVLFDNNKFAFSWPVPTAVEYIIYGAVLALCIWYCSRSYKKFSMAEKVGWLLVYAGAASNIGERLVRGSVRDYLYIYHGIFNLADFYILFGIFLLLIASRPPVSHQPRRM